jgi:hypothetical protein
VRIPSGGPINSGTSESGYRPITCAFASLLIQQGESLVYVKEQMGHASIQITVDIYGHLVPGGNRAAVDRLDDVAVKPESVAQPLHATRRPAYRQSA